MRPYESIMGIRNLDSSSRNKAGASGEALHLTNRSRGGVTLGGGSCRINRYIVGVVVYQVALCSVKSSQNVLGEYLGGKMMVPLRVQSSKTGKQTCNMIYVIIDDGLDLLADTSRFLWVNGT